MWLTGLRILGGMLGMLLITTIMGRWGEIQSMPALGKQWPRLVVAAFVGQFLSMVFWLGGFKYTQASVASVLNETSSIFILLLAAFYLAEPLNRRSIVAVILTFSGVACMLFAAPSG